MSAGILVLLPLPSRQATERTEMHVVILRYIAATDGSDACIVASPVSVCIYVILYIDSYYLLILVNLI